MVSPPRPFTILALAPFSPTHSNTRAQTPSRVDPSAPDEALQQLDISLSLPLTMPGGELRHIALPFRRMRDFHPDQMVKNSDFLSGYANAKQFLQSPQAKKMAEDEIRKALDKWPQLSDMPLSSTSAAGKRPSGDPLNNILDMVALPDEAQGPVDRQVSTGEWIDGEIRRHLADIFKSPGFRQMESAWCGLQYVLKQRHRDQPLALEILSVNRETLAPTLDNLSESLSEKPPSVVIIDLPMDSSARDMALLKHVSRFAESLLVPAVVWATPAFFHLDSWSDFSRLSYLPHHLEEAPYAKWQRLRSDTSADWLSMTCNRFLTRFSYGKDNPIREAGFSEPGLPWISPVWGVAALLVRSLSTTGWPTHLTAPQRMRLEDLALKEDDGRPPISTETIFTDDRLEQFIKAGIMPLSPLQHKDEAILPAETTVGRLSLSYTLMLAMMAQLLFWCREQLPDPMPPEQLSSELHDLISSYWQHRKSSPPGDIDIDLGNPRSDGRIPLTLALIPSRDVLPPSSPIRLEISW